MNASVISADLIIMGNLQSKGEVTIDGQVQGDVNCAILIVGENAEVTGSVIAEEVVVRGRVLGTVRGNKVTLQSTAHVEGDVFHRALAIEQGAFFEGKSRRADDPMMPSQASDMGPRSNGHGGHGLPSANGSSLPN
jgi:cytoskeletal protein CcmA (bactofilin family)